MSSSINICFYGLNRSLSSTINSINKYIFDSLSSLGVTYQIYGVFSQVEEFSNDRSGEISARVQNNAAELIQFSDLKYVDQNAFDDSVAWEKVFEFGDFYSQIKDGSEYHQRNSSAKNIFRSLWCLKSSYALIPEDRQQFPTIFIRPDLEILSEIDWPFYLDLLKKSPRQYAFGKTDGVALVPSWHSWHGLNDRFAICSAGNACNAYANRFDSLIPFIEMSRHPIHPESFLFHILHASRVEVLPSITTTMSRLRANGVSQAEDFSQGSQSYSLQTETIACLNKLLQERTAESVSLRQQHVDLTTERSSLDSELTEVKQNCQFLSDENSKLLSQVKKVESSRSSLDSELTEVKQNRQFLSDENSKLLSQVKKLESALDEMDLQCRNLLSQAEERHNSILSQLENSHVDLATERSSLDRQLTEVKQNCQFLSDENSKLLSQVKKLESALDEMDHQCRNLLSQTDERHKSLLSQIENSKEISSMAMSQLVRVQEELEYYYLKSCNLLSLVEGYSKFEDKATQLILKIGLSV